jgi:hypothetical protein
MNLHLLVSALPYCRRDFSFDINDAGGSVVKANGVYYLVEGEITRRFIVVEGGDYPVIAHYCNISAEIKNKEDWRGFMRRIL